MTRVRIRTALFCAAIAAVSAAGCAEVAPITAATPATSGQAAAPHVWDCGLVSSGSPSKYVCDGKVYTTFQLAKIRLDEIKKYESGK